jgi:hypothetical protein
MMQKEHVIRLLREAHVAAAPGSVNRVGAALADAERAVSMWLDDHPDDIDVSAGREMLAALREGFDDLLAPA